jgi:hypothetical protein
LVGADPSLVPEVEEDVMAECTKIGPIDRLRVYENHPEGVVMVKFKDKQAGLKCIQIMNGRWYGPTLLHVESTRLFCNWATTKHCLLLPSRETIMEKFNVRVD